MTSVLTLEAKLERTEKSTPWGFRMQGGKDFNSPLTIQKVSKHRKSRSKLDLKSASETSLSHESRPNVSSI